MSAERTERTERVTLDHGYGSFSCLDVLPGTAYVLTPDDPWPCFNVAGRVLGGCRYYADFGRREGGRRVFEPCGQGPLPATVRPAGG